jgi:hypothetical protein
MKTIAFILAFFASFAAHAEWFEVVKSLDQSTIVHGKGLKKNATGAEMLLQWNVDKTITFNIASISAKDCKNGYGQLSYRNLSGRIVQTDDYVSSGDNLNAEIGDWLCLFLAISGTTKGKSL